MSAGREFHVCGAATENARRASSVRTPHHYSTDYAHHAVPLPQPSYLLTDIITDSINNVFSNHIMLHLIITKKFTPHHYSIHNPIWYLNPKASSRNVNIVKTKEKTHSPYITNLIQVCLITT